MHRLSTSSFERERQARDPGSLTPEQAERLRRQWPVLAMAALAVLLAAEVLARQLVALHVLHPPTRHTILPMDTKAEAWPRFEKIAAGRSPGVLFLGTSTCGSNIAPHAVEQALRGGGDPGSPASAPPSGWVAYNGGVPGLHLEDMAFMASWYHQRWAYTHLVVVIEPWAMLPGVYKEFHTSLSRGRVEEFLLDHSRLMQLRGQLKPYDPIIANPLLALSCAVTDQGWYRSAVRGRQVSESDRRRGREDRTDFLRKYQDDDLSRFEPAMELARRLRIPVVFVLSPVRADVVPALPPKYTYEHLRGVVGDYAARNGAHMIDMTDFPSEPRDWYDTHHLLSHAAVRYSEALGKRLASLWGAQGVSPDFPSKEHPLRRDQGLPEADLGDNPNLILRKAAPNGAEFVP